MTNLEEKAIWEDVVFMIQRNTPVGGGPNGPANKPHIALANRTQYLKEKVENITDDLSRALSSLEDNPAFQANNERIENLKDPENGQDAATKNYVDTTDKKLQEQINRLIETQIGYESVGNFNEGCTLNTRNEIVYDEQTKKYYGWAGNLPHQILPQTNVIEEMSNGLPWLLIENSTELLVEIENIKQITKNSIISKLYGFKKVGAQLILETFENTDNKTLYTSEFDEWCIAPGGCKFIVNDKDLLMFI